MRYLLQRHPFSAAAYFRRCLVITYAFPSEILKPLLAPGLVLDAYAGYGFLAVALVQTQQLRPSFLPAALGRDFFLGGYRIFTRLQNQARSLRGLQILRSLTDKRSMVRTGNLFTHYQYRLCEVEVLEGPDAIRWRIRTPKQEADLDVAVDMRSGPAPLPPGSPFADEKSARRFAGPLPYTFDYEPETHSIICVRGVRASWSPQPVAVSVSRNTFLQREPFCRATPILATCFHVHDVAYKWARGVRIQLWAR